MVGATVTRWTEWILRHRALVVVAWLALAAAGGVLAPRTVDALSYEFGLPGQPAYEVNTKIAQTYGGGGALDPLLLVGTLEPGQADTFDATATRIAAAAPGTRIVTPAADPALLSQDERTAVAILYPPRIPGPDPYVAARPALQAAAAAAPVTIEVTGTSILLEGGTAEGGDRGVLIETLLGGLGALIVLALVFGSVLAIVPLLVAGVSILTTFLCLLGLTEVTDVSFVVQFLVALIGLGVAIDYSLLIVMRWREERAAGADDHDAVRRAMATAGRSVLFSGVTVAVSLAALVAVPLPFLRSIGLGGLLIPLLSVATSLSLLPVLLATAGRRLLWPRRRDSDPRSALWARVAGGVVRRPLPAAVATTLVLLALAAPVLTLRLGSPEIGSFQNPAVRAVLDAGLPAGVLRPTEIMVPADAVEATRQRVRAVEGVAAVAAPAGWAADGTRLLQVWFTDDPATTAGRATLDRVRAIADVGGSPAEDADFVTAVYGNAPLVVGAVVIATFLLLARALRSFWLPVKALLLNVVSIAAAYGMTVLIWQHGWGTDLLFGVEATGAITIWVPVAAFAFLFGLSMDYEVFILARMREAYDEHGDTPRAAVDGIAWTGRLVTCAALILFLAFVALSTVPTVEVKVLATALALGIAIDAVLVRAVLAPAMVVLLGRWNWWIPRGLAAALGIRSGRTPRPAPHSPPSRVPG
jgi:RND superfamily putative drug exporter